MGWLAEHYKAISVAFVAWVCHYLLREIEKTVALAVVARLGKLFKKEKTMRTILSLANGAVTLTETDGVVSLNLDESLQLGGGAAAGLVKVSDKGSIALDGETGLKLGEALLNSHIPASLLPLAQVVEGVANQAIKALE